MYFRQFVLNKILAPDVSTMEILNPKFGTVPKKNSSIYGQQIASSTFLRNWKSCSFWPALWNNDKIYLKTVGSGKIFQKFCWKNCSVFYICIKLFRTQLKMAQQTNFVKLNIMQIKILSFWLSKPILLNEIKSQTWTNANQRSIHLIWVIFALKEALLKNINSKF